MKVFEKVFGRRPRERKIMLIGRQDYTSPCPYKIISSNICLILQIR